MWGVQIVATEFYDDFRQLQIILNHPDGETVQKHHVGDLLEAKNALLGPLVTQKRPDTRPKCVVTIISAQSDQSVAVGTKSGPRGLPGGPPSTSGTPKVALRAKTGPFGVSGGPEKARYEAKVCGNHNSNPVRPIGSSWDQIWPLWTAQKLFSQLGSV